MVTALEILDIMYRLSVLVWYFGVWDAIIVGAITFSIAQEFPKEYPLSLSWHILVFGGAFYGVVDRLTYKFQ